MTQLDSLTLGHLDEIQHEAAAAAVLRVLEAHDIEVTMLPGGHDVLAGAMAAGRVDLLATAWLPDVDAGWIDPSVAETMGGVLYRPFLFWGLPAALERPGLSAIGDLAGPAAAGIDRTIVVARRVSDAAERTLAACGLTEAGYRLEILDDEAAYARASASLDAAAPAVLPIWQPHGLAHGGRVRLLDDPMQALGARQEARLMLRRGLRAQLDADCWTSWTSSRSAIR